ncbi:hypothetical protein HW115_14945 [Verrucomicrobiaceae bacterium N1E253]|uniref:Uncharacterized protein n=1 Tax=Oceaniferula marina TaxID=2748318 RepID=A0A851GI96_9BACT|nr:hypothetical protein [Oceaniferula marina]NWK56919.1 hypothetical protein [Oceaniferula marina]
MNALKRLVLLGWVLPACVLLVSSCEDEQLVAENQKLRQELSDLEKKVDLLKINAGEDPGDQTAAIKKANEELEQAMETIKRLDEEKAELESKHAAAEKDFRDYQKKYRIE